MSKIIFFALMLLGSFTALSAETKLITFGFSNGIVYDNSEWVCFPYSDVKKSKFKAVSGGAKYIGGTHQTLPLKFEYSKTFVNALLAKQTILNSVITVFSKYANESNKVISNIIIKGDDHPIFKGENIPYYVVSCCFIEYDSVKGNSNGYIYLYLLPRDYLMFVELRCDIADQEQLEEIMSMPIKMLTPLVAQ